MTTPAGSHTALMDSVYRHQRHLYDFTRKYYLLGRDRLLREMALPEKAAVVEVGCGTARNLIKLAFMHRSAQLFGVDASTEMLRTARKEVGRASLGGRVHLQHGYAEALSPALFGRSAPFDAVLFSYSLSMIPDWKQALRKATAALTPEGEIHVVDFSDLGGAGMSRTLLHWWLGCFHVQPREELLAALQGVANPKTAQLRILPGRYAFLFSARRDALTQFLE